MGNYELFYVKILNGNKRLVYVKTQALSSDLLYNSVLIQNLKNHKQQTKPHQGLPLVNNLEDRLIFTIIIT